VIDSDRFHVWLTRHGDDAPLSTTAELSTRCRELNVRWPAPRPGTTHVHRDDYMDAILGPLEALRMETGLMALGTRGGIQDDVVQAATDTLNELPTLKQTRKLFLVAWQSWFVYLSNTVARREAREGRAAELTRLRAIVAAVPVNGGPGPWEGATSGQRIWTRMRREHVVAYIEFRVLDDEPGHWVYSTPAGETRPANPNTLEGAQACADRAGGWT
jgi:hypothetical protein